MNIPGSSTLALLLAMTCILPALAAAVQWKKADTRFQAFLILMITGFVVEAIAFTGSTHGQRWILKLIYNCMLLVELVLFMQFFYRIKTIGLTEKYVLLAVAAMVWVPGMLLTDPLKKVNYYTAVIYAVLLLFYGVRLLSRQVLEINVPLIKNPLFLLAVPIIIYYSFFILSTGLMLLGLGNNTYATTVASLQKIFNAVCNLMYATAILCLPKRHRFP